MISNDRSIHHHQKLQRTNMSGLYAYMVNSNCQSWYISGVITPDGKNKLCSELRSLLREKTIGAHIKFENQVLILTGYPECTHYINDYLDELDWSRFVCTRSKYKTDRHKDYLLKRRRVSEHIRHESLDEFVSVTISNDPKYHDCYRVQLDCPDQGVIKLRLSVGELITYGDKGLQMAIERIASFTIQKNMRKWLAVTKYRQTLSVCILLQSIFRMFLQKLKNINSIKIAKVKQIQTWWRSSFHLTIRSRVAVLIDEYNHRRKEDNESKDDETIKKLIDRVHDFSRHETWLEANYPCIGWHILLDGHCDRRKLLFELDQENHISCCACTDKFHKHDCMIRCNTCNEFHYCLKCWDRQASTCLTEQKFGCLLCPGKGKRHLYLTKHNESYTRSMTIHDDAMNFIMKATESIDPNIDDLFPLLDQYKIKKCELCEVVEAFPKGTGEVCAIGNEIWYCDAHRLGTRKCPTCGIEVLREDGCNYVTCPLPECGTSFCYLCCKILDQRDHYLEPGTHFYNQDDPENPDYLWKSDAPCVHHSEAKTNNDE